MSSLNTLPRSVQIIITVMGILATILSFSLFTVHQSRQVLVLQFGKMKRIVQEPGLHLKIPFLEDVVEYDQRLLDIDLSSEEVIAADQKRMVVDSFLRYRITDPLKFYQTLKSEFIAQERLQTLASASLRRVIGSHPLSTLLSAKREDIMTHIREEVRAAAEDFGVEVVDVRIRHADLPKANSEAIYLRMKSEREREAKDFRAQGEELAKKTRAQADKERTILLAEAENKAQILYGEGDAEAASVLSAAHTKDPKFFEFFRALQAYKQAFQGDNTSFVVSGQGAFMKHFYEGGR